MGGDRLQAEAKRLHDLGLGVIWLQPKSKRPVKSRWTEGDRASWAELEREYSPGFNAGVRLGRPSMLDGQFLAVIDCDVKSKEPGHRLEMETALDRLFPGVAAKTARVMTGRGGGSQHLYVLTPAPVLPKRLAQSGEKVRVRIPSVKASRHEVKTLSADEVKAGWRLRAAWEISLMGQDQQVVLPPSLHPDTGRSYGWQPELQRADDLVVVGLGGSEEAGIKRPELARNGDFHALDVDLIGSSLPSDVVDMVLTGKDCPGGDRSAGLLKATIAMFKAGWTDDEIMSVLTDPDTFLGTVPFDHAGTTSRGMAAQWLYKYTMKKARGFASGASDFDAVEELPSGEDDDPTTAFGEDESWKERLERTKGDGGFRPKNNLKNCLLILKEELGTKLFALNQFSGAELYGRDTPWGGKEGAEIGNRDLIMMKDWFTHSWRFEPGLDKLQEAITVISEKNAFHPVREYLDGLEWDGAERLDGWLADYLRASGDQAYLRDVGRKVLCAMVARIYEPGTKFDQVMILEGTQGVGKSTAVRVLAGKWFSDAHMNIADKDSVLNMRSVWVMELGELSGMRKADVDQLKEFISRTVDRIRVPYGRRTEAFPRQCIFVGTTNGHEYLRDATGNRRFWPVTVGDCDLVGLARDRDQLLAEAVVAWRLGEPLYLDDRRVALAAEAEQSQRQVVDVWVEKLDDFLRTAPAGVVDRDRVSMEQLFKVGPFMDWRVDRNNQTRASAALAALGYHRRKLWDSAGKVRRWLYIKCPDVPDVPDLGENRSGH